MTLFVILILSHRKDSEEGDEISMRKDISVEKLIKGGEKMNKSELSRQYNCCWRTIDRRLNPEKYYKEKKKKSRGSDKCITNKGVPLFGKKLYKI